MDFSADGSDSWDSTPAQEKFIQNYFRGKEPQSSTVAKVSKKRKKNILTSDMPSTSIIPKKNSSPAIVVPKYSISEPEKTSALKQFTVPKTSSTKPSKDFDVTEIDVGLNVGTKSVVKKTKKSDFTKFIVPGNVQKTKQSNKKSLKNKHEQNDFTKESLNNVNVNNDSIKSSFQKDHTPSKKLNLKKRKSSICQISQTQGKLSKIDDDSNIKRMKDSKNTLNPKENFASADESGDSDEDEIIRNELKNTPIFKKLQKLMKFAPHLNPNFTKDMEANNSSCEEVSDEDWPSDIDEDVPDSEAEVSKGDHKDSSKGSDSGAKDSPYKKASYPSLSDSSQMKKKLKRSLSNSSSNDGKIKESNSETSKEMLETSNSQQSSNLISSLSTYRSPSNLSANVNAKRPSTFIEKAKLAAAKFRFLNEKLYTESGGDAFKYFQENRDEFEDYHLGYGMQVSKWPLNPVDEIISDLQKSKKDVVIADMGCGDAKIARVLINKKVHSFDLVAMHECVTACNISRVPLPDSNVDVVVFCLSLMGLNLVDYLQEAYRILKIGGSLKIAEVESRIENLDLFIKNLQSLGFELERKNTKNKLFVFLDLKKVKKGKASKAPAITLRPCLYKKR